MGLSRHLSFQCDLEIFSMISTPFVWSAGWTPPKFSQGCFQPHSWRQKLYMPTGGFSSPRRPPCMVLKVGKVWISLRVAGHQPVFRTQKSTGTSRWRGPVSLLCMRLQRTWPPSQSVLHTAARVLLNEYNLNCVTSA